MIVTHIRNMNFGHIEINQWLRGVFDLSEMPPYTHGISLARHVPMAANGTWSATVLAHRPQQCLLLSRRGPDAQRWRRVEAAGRPRRRSRRLHSRRHASLVLNCPALARCNSISCYRILKERVEPKCLAGRQLSGNCFWFDPLLLLPTRRTSGLMLRGGDLPK